MKTGVIDGYLILRSESEREATLLKEIWVNGITRLNWIVWTPTEAVLTVKPQEMEKKTRDRLLPSSRRP